MLDLCRFLSWFTPEHFSLEEEFVDYGLVFYLKRSCFSFCLLKMLIDGLEWCGLLWCFISCLDSHSDGTHSLTAEHPLPSKWCNATFFQIWWRNNLIWDILRVSTFSANSFFGELLLCQLSLALCFALQRMGGTLVILPTWSLKIFEMTTGTLCSAPPWNAWRAVKEIHFYILHPALFRNTNLLPLQRLLWRKLMRLDPHIKILFDL